MPDTSNVCVSLVRKWSPCGAMNTWVFCLSRRNALQCTIRSRSRWKGVRSEQSSSSGRSRPAPPYERTASGDSDASSTEAMWEAKRSATGPERWVIA